MNILSLKQHHPQRFATTPKSSAVMLPVVMRAGAGPQLLLIRRHARLHRYANDWCLPGGRQEQQDATLLSCAWREFSEETGIAAGLCTLLGELDDFYDGRGELVRPFICTLSESVLQEHLQLQPSEAEEYALLSIPSLDAIEQDIAQRFTSARHPAYVLEVFEQGVSKGHVWGLTASILLHLRDVLTGTTSRICKGEHFNQERVIHGS